MVWETGWESKPRGGGNMNLEREDYLMSRLSQTEQPLAQKICELSITSLPVQGAAIFLQVKNQVQGPLASAGALGTLIAEAEMTLGEGPVFEVVVAGRAKSFADLESITEASWPLFLDAALSHGVRAIHTFPLHLGAVQLGALEFYADSPGHLSRSTLVDCYALADLTTSTLLYMQSGLADSQFVDLLSSSDSDRLRIHQATGMVAEMLDCSLVDAVARMRAHAFSHELSLYELSTRVIDRSIRLEP
jgi:GAF domain-containing protein